MMQPACSFPTILPNKRKRGNQPKVVSHTPKQKKIKNELIHIKCWQIELYALENKVRHRIRSWKIPLFNITIMSKTTYFFLLPNILVHAIPVLQLCEFYDDIRDRSWQTFFFFFQSHLMIKHSKQPNNLILK